VIVLHSITVVCPRLLTVGDSVVLFAFLFFSFQFCMMPLQCLWRDRVTLISTLLLTYLLTYCVRQIWWRCLGLGQQCEVSWLLFCEVDTTRCVGKFYGSFNNILNVLGKRMNDMLAVHLIKTYCLPMLLYSCEIWAARPVDMRSVDISWNNAFRKIFNACWRER